MHANTFDSLRGSSTHQKHLESVIRGYAATYLTEVERKHLVSEPKKLADEYAAEYSPTTEKEKELATLLYQAGAAVEEKNKKNPGWPIFLGSVGAAVGAVALGYFVYKNGGTNTIPNAGFAGALLGGGTGIGLGLIVDRWRANSVYKNTMKRIVETGKDLFMHVHVQQILDMPIDSQQNVNFEQAAYEPIKTRKKVT